MQNPITRTGVIISVPEIQEAAAPLVVLSTNLEECFVIDEKGKGAELSNHLQQSVCVTGSIREDEKGRKIFVVKDYVILTQQ